MCILNISETYVTFENWWFCYLSRLLKKPTWCILLMRIIPWNCIRAQKCIPFSGTKLTNVLVCLASLQVFFYLVTVEFGVSFGLVLVWFGTCSQLINIGCYCNHGLGLQHFRENYETISAWKEELSQLFETTCLVGLTLHVGGQWSSIYSSVQRMPAYWVREVGWSTFKHYFINNEITYYTNNCKWLVRTILLT